MGYFAIIFQTAAHFSLLFGQKCKTQNNYLHCGAWKKANRDQDNINVSTSMYYKVVKLFRAAANSYFYSTCDVSSSKYNLSGFRTWKLKDIQFTSIEAEFKSSHLWRWIQQTFQISFFQTSSNDDDFKLRKWTHRSRRLSNSQVSDAFDDERLR